MTSRACIGPIGYSIPRKHRSTLINVIAPYAATNSDIVHPAEPWFVVVGIRKTTPLKSHPFERPLRDGREGRLHAHTSGIV